MTFKKITALSIHTSERVVPHIFLHALRLVFKK